LYRKNLFFCLQILFLQIFAGQNYFTILSMKNSSPQIRAYKMLVAACLVSLVISTFASYFFYRKWNEAEDKAIVLLNEKNTLAQNYNLMKNSFDKIFADQLVLRDENARVIILHAADSTRRYTARVYWNHYTRNVFIDPLSVPAPDSTKQYQLWAVTAGHPIDAGVFNAEPEQGIVRVKPVADADAWMVTLEPKGGSTVPTPGKMVLSSWN
jgi:hypothetical protein